MEKLNLPPFVPGDKVVVLISMKGLHTSINKGDVHAVIKCYYYNDGFDSGWVITFNNHPNGWLVIDPSLNKPLFALAAESKFRAVTFEKLCEEVELICEN